MGDFGKLHMHPFAALFPLLDDAALTALADDIKQNGQLEPITLDAEGTTLIDGRNRYRACEMVKVDPVYQRLGKHFAEVDLIRYIISKNLNRRHLDVGQRAMIGLEAAEALEREAKQRQREGGGDRKSATAKSVPPKSGGANRSGEVAHQVAALMKIGHSAVSQAKKVKDTSPRLAQDVRAGTLSLNDAYKQVRRSPGEAPTPQTSTIMVTLPTHTGESVQYKQPKSPATFNRTNDQVSWAPGPGIRSPAACMAVPIAMRASWHCVRPIRIPIRSASRRCFTLNGSKRLPTPRSRLAQPSARRRSEYSSALWRISMGNGCPMNGLKRCMQAASPIHNGTICS